MRSLITIKFILMVPLVPWSCRKFNYFTMKVQHAKTFTLDSMLMISWKQVFELWFCYIGRRLSSSNSHKKQGYLSSINGHRHRFNFREIAFVFIVGRPKASFILAMTKNSELLRGGKHTNPLFKWSLLTTVNRVLRWSQTFLHFSYFSLFTRERISRLLNCNTQSGFLNHKKTSAIA